uniref:Uncharacterized protein n=1 Tax=Romanomermis culicivorax TaxID=13658 RepID=A0A915HTT1_ROMCU
MCPSNYSDLDGNGQPIPYTGSSWCQIFAARAFCYNRCLPPDWRTDRYGNKIICQDLTCGGNGSDPSNITFRCICDVITPNQGNRIAEFRSGTHYTWSMVEEEFDNICVGQNATDINHFDPFNEYNV